MSDLIQRLNAFRDRERDTKDYPGDRYAFDVGFNACLSKLAPVLSALEFYANNDSWFGPQLHSGKRWFANISHEDCLPVTSAQRLVGGVKARKALADLEASLETNRE